MSFEINPAAAPATVVMVLAGACVARTMDASYE